MTIAVTGGSGFIGSHVVDALVDAGHDVVVLDTRPPHRHDVRFVPTDVLDLDALRRGLHGCDVVFHLAGVANVNDAAGDAARTADLNVTATARVWQAAREVGVQRSVLASTVWVYGAAAGDGPVDEGAPFDLERTDHIYTASKLGAELVVRSCHALYGQEFTILRYGIPFGPRMRDELVIARFVRSAFEGAPIVVHGDGSQYRNYVYVEDLADAHVRALASAGANQVFNLEGDEPVTVRQLVDTVADAAPRPVDVQYTAARAGDFRGRPVSAERARRLLGWRPQVSFADGLRAYIDWYLERAEPAAPPVHASRSRQRVAAAWTVLVLAAVAVHGGDLTSAATRTAVLLVAGLAAGLTTRVGSRTPARATAAALALTGVWLTSQATDWGIVAAATVLGAGVGLCSRVSRRAPAVTVGAGAAALLVVGAVASSAVAFWIGALLVVATTGAPAAAAWQRMARVRPATAAVTSSFMTVSLVLVAVVGATSANASWFGAPVRHGDRSTGAVAITVDAADAAAAETIARTLDAHHVAATFFFAGKDVRNDPSVVPAVLDANQTVGSGTYDRSAIHVFDPRGRQITKAEHAFRDYASVCPAFLRPPRGYHTPLLARSAHRRGMEMVGWDVGVDASRVGPERLARRVLEHVRSGSIVRIDATHDSAAAARDIDASLPTILDGLHVRHLEAVPLETLLSRPAYTDRCGATGTAP